MPMTTHPREREYTPDWWLFLVTLLLLSAGVVMVFNASFAFATEVHGDPWYFVRKQALWAVVGVAGMFAAMRVPYWKLAKLAVPALILVIGLLGAVLVIGHGALGAQRWIGVGPIKIQPSEFAKLAVVLFLARVIAARPARMRHLWTGVLPILAVVLFVILLVELQPDLGTAITILLTSLLVLFAGGAKTRWMVALLALFALAGTGLALRHGTDGYRWKRMITFVNPDADPMGSGYQISHSMIALGSGGATGVGFGQSREKRLGNLPAQRTDFIFAIVGEEMGLVGTGAVLLFFLLLAARGFHIASRTKSPFGALLATGITGMITVQSLVNIGVVTASLPATGVPLPFLSYGGSALVPTLIGIGILLNISQYPYYREAATKRAPETETENAERPAARRVAAG
jgi:cell division protein FtsW